MNIFLSLLFSLCSLACWADADVALVKTVSGATKVVRNGETLEAKPGMKLLASDKIVAGAGETVGLIFNDGTTLSAGPSTELDLREYVFDPGNSRYAFSLFLKKGTLVYTSGKLGKLAPSAVRLDTPRSSVGVRGTKFILSYE
ncbi:MAG: FecR domain-containing protein [Nitrosomonadales bacterium]|nr:FecR domain-containing protein [Nitrosomonadales bacterium]